MESYSAFPSVEEQSDAEEGKVTNLRIGLQVKPRRGERERERKSNEQLTGKKEQKIILTFLYFSPLALLILVVINHL